jgi:hypothetical protein
MGVVTAVPAANANADAASMPAKQVLILCPQGGRPVAELMASIGAELARCSGGRATPSIVNLRQSDAAAIRQWQPSLDVLTSFEEFRDSDRPLDLESEALRLARDYPGVNWWAVIASERSFTDSSFLLGGSGHRVESRQYAVSLLVSLVRYFESILGSRQFSAGVSPVADSLITHVFYKVARRFGIGTIGLSPNAWIREEGQPGFFLISDEFLHSRRMLRTYRDLAARELTDAEQERIHRFKRSIAAFDLAATYRAMTNKTYIVPAVSPNLKSLVGYLRENARRRREVEYFKIDVAAKTWANLVRVWRRWRSKHLLGSRNAEIPARSVFYPMHYQPEQTTLVGGIFFANQVAVIENIAKALPFGYTLVVKEHPRGRGARPAWQYRHLAHYPNIVFSDADSKQIVRQCEAVITITGTVGLEAMALDKPIIVLGDCYYDFADVVYRPASWRELAETLRRILIEGEYENNLARQRLIDRFFLAYLSARVPAMLGKESAAAVAAEICTELDIAAEANVA